MLTALGKDQQVSLPPNLTFLGSYEIIRIDFPILAKLPKTLRSFCGELCLQTPEESQHLIESARTGDFSPRAFSNYIVGLYLPHTPPEQCHIAPFVVGEAAFDTIMTSGVIDRATRLKFVHCTHKFRFPTFPASLTSITFPWHSFNIKPLASSLPPRLAYFKGTTLKWNVPATDFPAVMSPYELAGSYAPYGSPYRASSDYYMMLGEDGTMDLDSKCIAVSASPAVLADPKHSFSDALCELSLVRPQMVLNPVNASIFFFPFAHLSTHLTKLRLTEVLFACAVFLDTLPRSITDLHVEFEAIEDDDDDFDDYDDTEPERETPQLPCPMNSLRTGFLLFVAYTPQTASSRCAASSIG